MDRRYAKDLGPCDYCEGRRWEISATLIRCATCGVLYGRCDGLWRVDPDTIPKVAERKIPCPACKGDKRGRRLFSFGEMDERYEDCAVCLGELTIHDRRRPIWQERAVARLEKWFLPLVDHDTSDGEMASAVCKLIDRERRLG